MNRNDRLGHRRGVLLMVLVATLVLVLPLLMGNRTAETLALSGLALTGGALLIALAGFAPGIGRLLPLPSAGWQAFALVLTVLVALHILPSEMLARALGAYPDALWEGELVPGQWSPNPNATLRGWATFLALMMIAWTVASLGHRQRGLLWLVVTTSALLQALYGLSAHAAGSETIFGIWPRNNPDFVHGSFSNRNLFAGYLALTWPLAVAVWWRRSTPGLKRLPFELRVAGSVICGAIIGAALLGSASRLGSAAGLGGMLVAAVLWARWRARRGSRRAWPIYLTAAATLMAATWYGLTPLAERLAVTSMEEIRFEVFGLMLSELPARWWITGVGLGGFEAVFRQIQPADFLGWFDYAHNDLMQWLLETGAVGAGLLILVLAAIWRNARLNGETLPLYAGLAALVLVALGDFSWHIPATQVVLATYLGVLLTPDRTARPQEDSHRPRRRSVRRRCSASTTRFSAHSLHDQNP